MQENQIKLGTRTFQLVRELYETAAGFDRVRLWRAIEMAHSQSGTVAMVTMHFLSSTFGTVRDYLPDSVIRSHSFIITVVSTLVGRDSVAAQETRNDLDVTLQRNHVTDEERTAEIVTRLAHQILRWYTYLLQGPACTNQ